MADDIEILEAEVRLREQLKIDPQALQDEFVTCPALIATMGARHANAIGAALRAEIRRKKLWGLIVMQAREDLDADGELAQARENKLAEAEGRKPKDVRPRITESMVDARAQQSEMWQAVQEEEIVATVNRETAKGNFAAIMAKKDMLVQMGANARAEMERDPTIRDRTAHRRGVPD